MGSGHRRQGRSGTFVIRAGRAMCSPTVRHRYHTLPTRKAPKGPVLQRYSGPRRLGDSSLSVHSASIHTSSRPGFRPGSVVCKSPARARPARHRPGDGHASRTATGMLHAGWPMWLCTSGYTHSPCTAVVAYGSPHGALWALWVGTGRESESLCSLRSHTPQC